MKHRKWQGMGALAAGLVSLAAWAQTPAGDPLRHPEAEAAPPGSMGTATRHWLALQRDGRLAAGKPQALPGPVMEKIHERYLNSFTHPVPERFVSEKVGSGGGSN